MAGKYCHAMGLLGISHHPLVIAIRPGDWCREATGPVAEEVRAVARSADVGSVTTVRQGIHDFFQRDLGKSGPKMRCFRDHIEQVLGDSRLLS